MDRATTSSPSTTPVTSSLHEPPESHKRIHQPSSSHLDSTLSHFADPTFDPVDYLNNILPSFSLSLSSPQTTTTATATIPTTKDRAASATAASTPVSLAALSTQTQSLISQLNDEQQQQSQPKEPGQEAQSETQPASNEPLYLTHLRTLTNVRARLEQVIHTFGEAMEWPLAPSETSLASSFISVSAPEPGTESQHSREEKGKEVAKKLRAEIIELLDKDTGTTDADGVEAANRRVEALRELVGVWKGTAEEKARMRFVDGLAKLVEERRKVVQSETESKGGGGSKSGLRGDSNAGRDGRGGGGQEGKGSAGTTTTAPASGGGGGGLLRNLQRLRDEIYLD
ncbi:hypothetical protein RJ035_005996 [Blastomyces gilchristii]